MLIHTFTPPFTFAFHILSTIHTLIRGKEIIKKDTSTYPLALPYFFPNLLLYTKIKYSTMFVCFPPLSLLSSECVYLCVSAQYIQKQKHKILAQIHLCQHDPVE